MWECRMVVLLYIAGGSVKWNNHFGYSLTVSGKTDHTNTLWTSISLPNYLFKKYKCICPQKKYDIQTTLLKLA